MATEDLALYDETDIQSRLTVTSARAAFAALELADEVHLSDSKGAGFFSGDFIFRAKLSISSLTNAQTIFFMGVSNTQDSFKPIDDASGDEQVWEIYGISGIFRIYVVDLDGGAFNNSAAIDSLQPDSTVYYFEFERDESIGSYGNIKVTVWTVDYEDTLFGTQNINLATSKKDFQYAYAMQSKEDTGGYATTGYIEDLDLDAGAAPGRTTKNTRSYPLGVEAGQRRRMGMLA